MCAFYSLNWANERYEEWYQKSPRATKTVYDILSIDRETVVLYLANGSKVWEIIKSCRKLVGRLYADPLVPITLHENYSTFVEHSVRSHYNYLVGRLEKGLTVR